MDTNTGHLVDLINKSEKEIKEIIKLGYTPIPDELQNAAKKKLGDKKEAWVSLTSGGKLSKFAAKNRKNRKNRKNNRRMQKQSRKNNR